METGYQLRCALNGTSHGSMEPAETFHDVHQMLRKWDKVSEVAASRAARTGHIDRRGISMGRTLTHSAGKPLCPRGDAARLPCAVHADDGAGAGNTVLRLREPFSHTFDRLVASGLPARTTSTAAEEHFRVLVCGQRVGLSVAKGGREGGT